MNRKVLVIAIALMAVAMLATPIVGLVQAGEGQEKQYFKLYMEGTSTSTVERFWPSDDVNHGRGREWVVTGAFEVWIGEEPPIILTPADYSGSLDVNWNTKTLELTVKIHETITFDALGGTLEILSVDKLYNYGTPGMYGIGTFVGHGTGALEGVKVEGTSSSYLLPPLAVTREGTVMGWPT